MRGMQIEDIWARRDNGELPPRDDEESETYLRHTRLRWDELHGYHHEPLRPDGRKWGRGR